MWNALIAAASGVIIVGVLIVFGIVITTNLGSAVSGCPSWTAYNSTSELCTNLTGVNTVTPSLATSTANSVSGYYGTTSGGLASYLPLVITMAVIGGLLGFFGFKLFAGAGQGR